MTAAGLSIPILFLAIAHSENLPPLKPQASRNILLNRNPGFDEADSSAWRFSDWPPRKETSDRLIARSIFYDEIEKRSGKTSICFDVGTVGPDRFLGVRQMLDVKKLRQHNGKRIRLSCWILLASGSDVHTAHTGIRLWGKSGQPPLSATSIRMQATRGKWNYFERTFTLHLGKTGRADLKVGLRTVPAGQKAPVCFADDCRLEALTAPALSATLLSGKIAMSSDRYLSARIEVGDSEWKAGIRRLRWDVTSPDGLQSFAQGSLDLLKPASIVEPALPNLAFGAYGLRFALESKQGERLHEALKEFRYAKGPFEK
ncbi:MAG: hypothetical protein QF886_15015 [Planctomycetota bacterium]|nr:hypothetical protein [Planctomycetota bacterium]